MSVSPLGSLNLCSAEQPLITLLPILVMPSGKLISVKAVQSLNALPDTLTTVKPSTSAGMVKLPSAVVAMAVPEPSPTATLLASKSMTL